MKFRSFGVVAAACLLAAASVARAEEKPGSVYVQCDGQPETMSLLKITGYLLAITATAGVVGGIVGAPETADVNKRVDGEKAAAACDAALAQNKNELRAAQLKLGKAIHLIEADKYDAAITEAQGAAAAAGAKGAEEGFQHSMGLSALEIQAMAQVRAGRRAEAEATALKMAAAAPYDVLTQVRALEFIGLTPAIPPEKRAYFERATRLLPSIQSSWAGAQEWAGDWKGAAATLRDSYDTALSFVTDPTLFHPAALLAHQSVDLMLAGDMARSNKVADEAKAALDAVAQSTDSNRTEQSTRAQELLDFQAVGRTLAEGRVAEARAAFAGRSRWFAPAAPHVAELTERLRRDASPAQLTGALAADPAKIRADGLDLIAKQLTTDKPPLAPRLFAAVRYQAPGAFSHGLASDTWRVEKSRMLLARRPQDKYIGEGLAMTYGYYDQEALGEALLLHAALRAQAQGKTGFLLYPTRSKVTVVQVKYGDPGKDGMPTEATFSAAKVVEDLSGKLPAPPKK